MYLNVKSYRLILFFILFKSIEFSAQKSSDKYTVNCTNQNYSNTEITFDIEIENKSFRPVKAWISGGEVDENNNWSVQPEISNDSIQMRFEYELVGKGSNR